MAKSSIHMKNLLQESSCIMREKIFLIQLFSKMKKTSFGTIGKQAYKIFRNELAIRSESYTKRTKQKLQKNTATSISAVVNLEYYHTLKDLEELRNYLETEFGTKVFQMAIHRDEGKLINVES